jgi:VCBS repeat-containing protein
MGRVVNRPVGLDGSSRPPRMGEEGWAEWFATTPKGVKAIEIFLHAINPKEDPRGFVVSEMFDRVLEEYRNNKMGQLAEISGNLSHDVSEDSSGISGNLTLSDPENSSRFFEKTVVGNYGSFNILQSGSWTYSLDQDAVQHLRAGEVVTERAFPVNIIESGLISDVQTEMTFHINGVNDPAEISGAKIGSVAEDGAGSAVGVLTIVDPDTDEAFFKSPGDIQGAYGTLNFTAAGSWTYILDNEAVQYLGQGDVTADAFKLETIDGSAANVVVTIDGRNDPAVIGGQDTGKLTGSATSVGGTLTISDPDQDEFYFKDGSYDGQYGSLSLSADGRWTYTASSIPVTQGWSDTVTIQSVDGTAHSITVSGENSPPVIPYISQDIYVGDTFRFTGTFDVLADSYDPDGDEISLTWTTADIAGRSEIVDGKIYYDSGDLSYAYGFTRDAYIRYIVTDEHGAESYSEIALSFYV